MEMSYSNQALALISSSSLAHPDKRIVQVFIEEAVDPELSAHYLLQYIGSLSEPGNGTSKDLKLFRFLTEWTALLEKFRPVVCNELPQATKNIIRARDGDSCCVTGLKPQFFGRRPLVFTCIIPPSALSRSKGAPSGYLDGMLEAFITPAKREWLCSLFGAAASLNSEKQKSYLQRLENIILLSPGVHRVFSEGDFRLGPEDFTDLSFPMPSSESLGSDPTSAAKGGKENLNQVYEVLVGNVRPCPSFPRPKGMDTLYTVTMTNRCPGIAPLPNAELFGIQAHFAKGLTWLAVAEQMKTGWPSTEGSVTSFNTSVFHLLRHLWLKVPPSLRVKTYLLLRKIGNYFYGSSTVLPGAVTRLPFNLYLKAGVVGGVGRGITTSHANQARAMDLVERYTQIPAPQTTDLISTPAYSFLLMTRAPGTPLGPALHRMSNAEITQLVEDLRRCLWQMRSIPNPFGPQSVICSAHGEGCFDFRLNGSTARDDFKFETEAQFNKYLLSEVPEREHEKATQALFISHHIYFTHGDLNMRNILVDNGRLSGIVDWENAGWLPEYWDYTKIHYTNKWMRRFLDDVVEKVFPDYKEELENERFLWQWVRPFG